MSKGLSSVYSSTFSVDLNKVGDPKSVELSKLLCIAKIGIGIIELLISSTFLCYGIIFLELVNLDQYTLGDGLWTSILYYASWSLTGPWCRFLCEYLDYYNFKLYRYVICVGAIGLFTGITVPGYIYAYGIFSGGFSCLITTQLKFFSSEKLNIDPKMFDCNIHCGRAISLLIMPHLVLGFVENYSINQMTYLYGAFLLNVIPAVLIIRAPSQIPKKVPVVSRYHTLTSFSTQMQEMKNFTSSGNTSSIIYSESDASEDVEDDPQKDMFLLDVHDVATYSEAPGSVPATRLHLQNYFSKIGVNILPEIPEEQEDSDEDDINIITSKRLSKISTKLEQINEAEKKDNAVDDDMLNERQNSIKDVFNITDLISINNVVPEEKIQNIEFIPNYKDNNYRILTEIKQFRKCCCYCPSYKIFTWRRRLRSFKDFIEDNLLRPFRCSFKSIYFYPALISKISLALMNSIFLTLLPSLTLAKNSDFTIEDTAFCLTYMAFTWFLFLMLLPLVVTFSGTKYRMTFILGLTVCSVSVLFVTRRKVTTNYMILSCLLFGFGYGGISFVETMLYRSFIGTRRWSQIEGTLETVSAFFVILIYYFISINDLDMLYYFPFIASIVYFSNALLWTAMPVVVFIISYFKRNNSYSLDEIG